MRSIVTRSVGVTLRPLSATYRRKVRDAYGQDSGRLDADGRRRLARAIFAVESELEDTQHAAPMVAVMRAVRNVLYDDLGENESVSGARYPNVEVARAIIGEKRRAGRSDAFRRGLP